MIDDDDPFGYHQEETMDRRTRAEFLRDRAADLRREADRAGETLAAAKLRLRAAVLELRALLRGWPR